MRTRALAVVVVLVSIMAFGVIPGVPATADTGDANIWVGPGCLGGSYTCQADGSVTQSSTSGRAQSVTCTLDVCDITQSNNGGFSNEVVITQAKSQVLTNPHVSELNQVISQSATIHQTNTGSGTNTIHSSQKITESASENQNTPVSHRQEGHQSLNTTQQSASGDQTLLFTQALYMTSDVHAPHAVQRQNADDNEGAPDQDVHISITSTSGKNTVGPLTDSTGTCVDGACRTQYQRFRQSATGPLRGNGSGPNNQAFQGADQQQGNPNDTAANMVADPFESSNTQGGVTTNAYKDWDRVAATPKAGYTNNQFAYDELTQILGKLSPPFVDASETAVLGNQGIRYCVQDLQWHSDEGHGAQSCNGHAQQVNASAGLMHQETCDGTATCPPPVTETEGLSASGINVSATTGQSFTGNVANVTDANTSDVCDNVSCPLSATINWGDNTATSPGSISGSNGSFTVSGTHTYASQGSYTITTDISKPSKSLTTQATSTATVTTAQPPPPTYEYLAKGSFVIGDLSSAASLPQNGSKVTWWGDQWANQNSLSGGKAPSSFKGWENTLDHPTTCGSAAPKWGSKTGNSPPPNTVPQDMVVIVTSKVTGGNNPQGDIAAIVVVHTDPGYTPSPGTPGTGKVTQVICSSNSS